jgi:hypothetical protein
VTGSAEAAPPRNWLPFLYAFVAYAALAALITYPLIRHLGSTVPHDLGDPLLSTGILWWNAHVMPLTERWWNGFAFYPAPGMLAFSDHRLGESLLASPLQWLGASPITAYNLTLLATFPLSAIAAHWLAFVLTRRHDAAVISGLCFGFCPYRFAHLPHLELLAAFGMPLALVGLHQYRATRQPRWLVLFSLALVLQGLCTSYYLLFFLVMLGLWILWFCRIEDARLVGGILVAAACAGVTLLPIAIGFSHIHARYDFERSLPEIVDLSADLTSYLTAHATSTVWGWTAKWAKPEGELFPGATIVLLTLVGVVAGVRRDKGVRDRLDRLSWWLLPLIVVSAGIAFCGWRYAPWRIDVGALRVSSDAPFKPMSVAVLLGSVWIAMSSRMRRLHARRSTFAFYVVATVALAVFSLGPKPAVAGHQFLYEAPYTWLMRVPIFGSVRAPARFGLSVVLTLSISGALAFCRLPLGQPARRALGTVIVLGIIADSWIATPVLPALPALWPAARADGFAAVLELPAGDVMADIAAMYRAIDHRHPVVNGNSGFEPRHYFTLQTALQEHDSSVFEGFAGSGRILAVVERKDDLDGGWDRFLAATPHIARLSPDEDHRFYAVEPPAAAAAACDGDTAPIAAITDNDGHDALAVLTDHDPHTWWATAHAQRPGDQLLIDLGRVLHPCAISVAVGEFRVSYARDLIVESSTDKVNWGVVARRRMAGPTIKAALDDPRYVPVIIPLAAADARFIRLGVGEAHQKTAWLVTDVAVRVAR